MEYDPSQLEIRQRYKLLIGSVLPRPIAFVSTVSPAGALNLAPFSFFTAVGSDPMMVLFCPANREDGSEKDTLRNAKLPEEGGVGEFVVNVATEFYANKVAATAEGLAHGRSEFELVGLTPAPSRKVRPPRVAESPISLECRTVQVIRTQGAAPLAGNVVLGEVVLVHVADEMVDQHLHLDPDRLALVGRMGGLGYCYAQDCFQLPMGVKALELGPPVRKR